MSRAEIEYTPDAVVCAKKIEMMLDNGVIEHCLVTGGCQGNSQAVALLVRGMRREDVIARLSGINCKGRGTSCADQLAKALYLHEDKTE